MAIFACPGRAGLGRFLDLTPQPYVEGAVAVKKLLAIRQKLVFFGFTKHFLYMLIVMNSDYILHSEDFFSSSLSKRQIIWAVTSVVDVAAIAVLLYAEKTLITVTLCHIKVNCS